LSPKGFFLFFGDLTLCRALFSGLPRLLFLFFLVPFLCQAPLLFLLEGAFEPLAQL